MLWEEDLSSEMERDGEEEREIQGDIVRVLAHGIIFNSPQTLYRYYINFLTLTKSQSKPLGSDHYQSRFQPAKDWARSYSKEEGKNIKWDQFTAIKDITKRITMHG